MWSLLVTDSMRLFIDLHRSAARSGSARARSKACTTLKWRNSNILREEDTHFPLTPKISMPYVCETMEVVLSLASLIRVMKSHAPSFSLLALATAPGLRKKPFAQPPPGVDLYIHFLQHPNLRCFAVRYRS
jgi:hypothetical protein